MIRTGLMLALVGLLSLGTGVTGWTSDDQEQPTHDRKSDTGRSDQGGFHRSAVQVVEGDGRPRTSIVMWMESIRRGLKAWSRDSRAARMR